MANQQLSILAEGQQYMQTWPLKRELYAMFPECRVIAATRFAIKITPPLAVSLMTLQIWTQGFESMFPMLAMVVMILSLPVQGLIWLGLRAKKRLPPSTRQWFYDIKSKMAGRAVLPEQQGTPKYRDLAIVLDKAFNQMDKAFTQHWF